MQRFTLLVTLLILVLPLGAQNQKQNQQLADPKSTVLFDEETPLKKSFLPPKPVSILADKMVVAYYGNPLSPKMGILGEQPMEKTADMLEKTAQEYGAVPGVPGVIPAFHIIYATVWADGNVGILPDSVVEKYINYAAQRGFIVILDHQLGKMDVSKAVAPMLHWLDYPNVHLAIDPEWKTLNPAVEIGQIQAQDINNVEQMMEDYLISHDLPGKRMLIVHQFHAKMIQNREQVKSDFEHIDLVHHADGWGTRSLKLGTYSFIASVKNMPIKGFKIFLHKSWKIKGMDTPVFTPEDVMQLQPRPVYVSYQ